MCHTTVPFEEAEEEDMHDSMHSFVPHPRVMTLTACVAWESFPEQLLSKGNHIFLGGFNIKSRLQVRRLSWSSGDLM